MINIGKIPENPEIRRFFGGFLEWHFRGFSEVFAIFHLDSKIQGGGPLNRYFPRFSRYLALFGRFWKSRFPIEKWAFRKLPKKTNRFIYLLVGAPISSFGFWFKEILRFLRKTPVFGDFR
jgi:hypothetical protein